MSLPDRLESKNMPLFKVLSFFAHLSNLPNLALGGTLQLSDSDYTFFGRLTSLRQNILSAIKVMKSGVSKMDEDEQEDE